MHVQCEAVSLHHASRRGDDDDAGHARLGFLPVQRLLSKERGTAIHVRKDSAPESFVIPESEAKVACLACRAAGHLRRLVAEGRKLTSPRPYAAHGLA